MGATCSNCNTVNLDSHSNDQFLIDDRHNERPIDSLRAIRHIKKQKYDSYMITPSGDEDEDILMSSRNMDSARYMEMRNARANDFSLQVPQETTDQQGTSAEYAKQNHVRDMSLG